MRCRQSGSVMSRPLDLRQASGLLAMLNILFVLWSGVYVAVTAQDNSSACSTFIILCSYTRLFVARLDSLLR